MAQPRPFKHMLKSQSLSTWTFQEFFDSDGPKYAILSHRWGSDEVSYHELQRATKDTKAAAEPKLSGAGFLKILKFREQAARDELEWVWVDTCCINKHNGAELSEAINSMYRWYRDAGVCYNHLDDVKCGSFDPQRGSDEHIPLWIAIDYNPSWTPLLESFKKSKWFTRGWTLQELLAPVKSQFYDKSWRLIASRSYLAEQINEATGIAEKFLWGPAEVREQHIASACVAKKMNWLTRRKTSRAEDMAYCMLGLLRISMPLLYGEGEKAFLRLQMQIVSTTDDESIFAWGLPGQGYLKHEHPDDGMLASRPSCFAGSDRVEIYRESERVVDRLPYAMTNTGLQLNVVPDPSEVPDLEYKLELNWYKRSENDPYNARKQPIEILLTKPSSSARLWKRDSSVVLPEPRSKPRNQGGSHLVLNVFQPRDIHDFYRWYPGQD